MNPPPLWQELVKSGVQALVVVVGLIAGWALLRRQERIKREEELWAGMRKLRADALVKSLEALGRFHNAKDQRLHFEGPDFSSTDMMLRNREHQAFVEAIDTQADLQFLLGPHAALLGERVRAMATSGTTGELSEVVAGLHAALEKWIPSLEPHRKH